MQLEGQVLHFDSAGEILKCEPSNEILNLTTEQFFLLYSL